jgi:hypothetical protein
MGRGPSLLSQKAQMAFWFTRKQARNIPEVFCCSCSYPRSAERVNYTQPLANAFDFLENLNLAMRSNPEAEHRSTNAGDHDLR